MSLKSVIAAVCLYFFPPWVSKNAVDTVKDMGSDTVRISHKIHCRGRGCNQQHQSPSMHWAGKGVAQKRQHFIAAGCPHTGWVLGKGRLGNEGPEKVVFQGR